MDRSTVLTLIREIQEQDKNGVWQSSQITKDVFCQVSSISRAEFYEAGRNGLNPEFVLTMFTGDYSGERICSLNGQMYSIYRTYLGRNDTIELYVIRKGGTNGQEDNS